jgi:manganese transport protein
MVAATALQGSHTSTLADAYHGLSSTIGTGVALAFAVAMLASGVASSSVGTYAGQVVAQGFVSVSIPLWARRIATLLPALVLLASGANPTTALVISQVTLSFGIPAALVPLLVFTARRDVMGAYVNRPVTTWVAGTATVLIIMLNGLLLVNLWHGG